MTQLQEKVGTDGRTDPILQEDPSGYCQGFNKTVKREMNNGNNQINKQINQFTNSDNKS